MDKPDNRTFNRVGMDKLRAFFDNNDGEELTADDAAQKLGVTLATARTYLGALAGDGVLERVSIYRKRRTP